MLFFKTQRGQVVLNFIFAFFAAVVILGALFKIRHWPAADEMITLGLMKATISSSGTIEESAPNQIKLPSRNFPSRSVG